MPKKQPRPLTKFAAADKIVQLRQNREVRRKSYVKDAAAAAELRFDEIESGAELRVLKRVAEEDRSAVLALVEGE